MFNFSTLTSTGNWRADRERLRQAKKELDEVVAEAPTLANYLGKKFNETRERLAEGIIRGAISEQQTAIAKYQKALRDFSVARVREAARWNLPALHAERQAIIGMIGDINHSDGFLGGGPDKTERLQELYLELMAGAIERPRACLETFANLTEMGLTGNDKHGNDVRYSVVDLVVKAKQEIPNLRVTDEMLTASNLAEAAKADLLGKQAELLEVGHELQQAVEGPFASGPITRALRQVIVNQGGELVEILDPKDVRVTGVDLSRLNLEGEK